MGVEAAADSRADKTGAGPETLAARWHDEAAALGWTPTRLSTAVRATTPQAPRMPTLPDVIEHLSAAGSTWTRADILQAVCDLTPPLPRFSGRDWANAVEHACTRVAATCTSLDPPDVSNAPVRTSDGRPVWVAPTDPGFTSDTILAQEERVLLFAMDAHHDPDRPSPTVDTAGLDILQASAARAVAGDDTLVLVVGPAGTGKTTMLRRAVDDLARHRRPVFGVAPTAKAAKVLRDETGMPADTVAKLLHEWGGNRPPGDHYRLGADTTVMVDEAGMLGTGALDQLVQLTVSQHWRLVLVGDPRQLQAVGRGGMFDELCRTGRAHELATTHRFRHPWEQQASLLLRAGNPEALDAYFAHRRINAGTFDDLAADAARQWMDHTRRGHTVALVAETNEHVDALNQAVQAQRRLLGHLGERGVGVAGGETASVGDLVVTRRNDRTLRTDRGEPVRNRDRWTILAVDPDGSLTVSHLNGHGTTTLPTDYARHHVRLGYAATAHGHQGDTVDIGLAVVTQATSHRSLYVGATRGRQENRLLVVTDDTAPEAASDVLERVLTNDRADIPAVVQRRNLARQVPQARAAEDAVTVARRALRQVQRSAKPYLEPLGAARSEAQAAEAALRERRAALADAPRWRRRGMTAQLGAASDMLDAARSKVDALERLAAPHTARIDAADKVLRQAEHDASDARLRDRIDRPFLQPQSRTIERSAEIEPPGLEL